MPDGSMTNRFSDQCSDDPQKIKSGSRISSGNSVPQNRSFALQNPKDQMSPAYMQPFILSESLYKNTHFSVLLYCLTNHYSNEWMVCGYRNKKDAKETIRSCASQQVSGYCQNTCRAVFN